MKTRNELKIGKDAVKPLSRVFHPSQVNDLIQQSIKALSLLEKEAGPRLKTHCDRLSQLFADVAIGFEQYRSLFENAVQGFFITTLEGKVVDCNPAFAHLLGYDSPEQVRQIEDFGEQHYLQPADRDKVLARLKRHGKLINNEVRLKRRDGTPRWVLVNNRLTENGLIEGICIDITAEKQAVERLHQSEEKYRRIIETAGEGFLMMDVNLNIMDVNQAFCRMIGYPKDEIIGKIPIDFADEEFKEFILIHREDLLSRDYREFECAFRSRDGRKVPVLVHGNTLRDPDGTVIGHVALVADMTEYKKSLILAGEVQKSLLPQRKPNVPGLDVAGRSVPCEEIGGDYFDFLCGEEQKCGPFSVVVGDIAGHGVDAALYMATARAFLRMRALQSGSLSDIVTDLNRHLSPDAVKTGRFMTLFYMAFDPEKKAVRWVRAGHDPAILYDPAQDRFEELKGDGVALGIDEKFSYRENIKTGIADGQIMAIGTDGVWEALDRNGEMFSKQRFCRVIREHARRAAAEILDAVFDELGEFTKGVLPEDDITLVVVKIQSSRAA
jgi:sigma-B regulation protein RsbU (phosphoserine phosphatase)